MDLRERIDSSPMSPFQWVIIALCVLLNCLDGFDVMAMAFTASPVADEFGLSGSQLGVLLSAGLVGMAAGSLVLRPFADRIGRRPMILMCLGLASLGMLLGALSQSALMLGATRVLTGLGVGGILACTNVIASEYSSSARRGLAIGIYTAGYGIGAATGWAGCRLAAGAARLALHLRLRRGRHGRLAGPPRRAAARVGGLPAGQAARRPRRAGQPDRRTDPPAAGHRRRPGRGPSYRTRAPRRIPGCWSAGACVARPC